jgi:hypothetical protein
VSEQYGPAYRDIRVILRSGVVHLARATAYLARWRCTCGLRLDPLEVVCLAPYVATVCPVCHRCYEFQPALDAVKEVDPVDPH